MPFTRRAVSAAFTVALVTSTTAAAQPAAGPPPAPPSTTTVQGVVVTGQAAPITTSIDRRSYSVAGDLQAQTGSIADALRNIPSVQVDLQGNLSLRGQGNVTILVDGKPSAQFRGASAGQALQQIPADRIERVEVITNPSAEFQSEGSGIINLVMKKARGAGRTGSARLEAVSGARFIATGSQGYNSGSLSWTTDAQYRHDTQRQVGQDDRAALDPAGGDILASHDASLGHVEYDYLGARSAVDFDYDAKNRLSGEVRVLFTSFDLRATDDFQRTDPTGGLAEAFNRVALTTARQAYGGATGTWRRRFRIDGEELVVSANYEQVQRIGYRREDIAESTPALPESFDRLSSKNAVRQTDLKADYTLPFSTGKLKVGYALQIIDNGFNNGGSFGAAPDVLVVAPAFVDLFDDRQVLNQAYVTYERPLGAVTVLAGLRLEDESLDLTQTTLGLERRRDDLRANPSLHLAYKLTDAQQLTASYSRRVQRPNPEDLNPFAIQMDPTDLRAGNLDLKLQQTDSFEFGYQLRRSPAVYMANLYWRRNKDAFTDDVRDLGDGIFLTQRVNAERTRNAGLELIAAGRLMPTLTYNLSGDLYWSQFDPTPFGAPRTRTATTVFGHATLNWQVTKADFVQVGAFENGKRLTAQGFAKPSGAVNLGYRHRIDERLSVLVVVQDLFKTLHDSQVIETPALKTGSRRDTDSRVLLIGISRSFGGRGGRDPGFEFKQGGTAPQ
ncbi:TonB-dependent receptor domain-containing protein [Phenylobacterium sp.]|jgi:outer membrane receptor protein involved in Fe transport|uniref:TonB-dependent receptor domain-containing protein n=1 Tax=Phenylobacterium sp. TaxID=1871053 RepID=UPI002F407648